MSTTSRSPAQSGAPASASAASRRRKRPSWAPKRVLYPFAWGTPVLVVPGLHDSGPGHWQTLWQYRYPELIRVRQRAFAIANLDRWAETVAEAVEACDQPPVVVAHSFGCLATVRAAGEFGVSLAGALLVAPADPARFDIDNELLDRPLPFPSTLVASTSDPWLKLVKAGTLAAWWGSRLVDAGNAGHINAESGHGGWPEGLAHLRDVAERAVAAGTLRTGQRAARGQARAEACG